MVRIVVVALTLLAVPLASLASTKVRTLSDDQWREDLQQLATSIKTIHFKPFHVLPESDFDAAVDELQAQIPDLSDREIIVRMTRIVAKLRDGHTRLHIPRLYPGLALPAELGHSGTEPPRFDSLRFRQSPVRFELFSDGLFVIEARPDYEQLIGQKVLSIDRTPIDEAIQATRSVSFFENDSRAALTAPDRLALPEVTHMLGVSNSSELHKLTTVDRDGRETTTALRTLSNPGQTFISGAPTPLPRWLARRSEFRWYEVLPDSDAIYVQINEFEENPATPYSDFVRRTIDAARAAKVSRFVVDLRHNFGGMGAWVTPFVTGLSASEFNEYGRLYILVGRTTFSAAQLFLHRFEEFTYAIFVGEPSGAKPSHFGDARRIVLENSGLTLRVSTIYWHSWLANDFRDAISPHISVPFTSYDFFDGLDPVLDAALRYEVPDGLAKQIDEQFREGKNQNALLLYQRYMSDPGVLNRREVVPDLVTMADRLVDDGYVRQGYFVYFLANRSFPGDVDIESGLARVEALMKNPL